MGRGAVGGTASRQRVQPGSWEGCAAQEESRRERQPVPEVAGKADCGRFGGALVEHEG